MSNAQQYLTDALNQRIVTVSSQLLQSPAEGQVIPHNVKDSDRTAYGIGCMDTLRFVLSLVAEMPAERTRQVGRVAKADSEANEGAAEEAFSEHQAVVLQSCVDHDMATFNSAAGRSIGTLLRRESIQILVEGGDVYPALTDKGKALANACGIVPSEKHIDLPENTIPVKIEKLRRLTDTEQEAMHIAFNNNKQRWDNLHGKTRNSAVRSKWITMTDGGMPTITPLGLAMAALSGLKLVAARPPLVNVGQDGMQRRLAAAHVSKTIDTDDDGPGIGQVVGTVSNAKSVVM